jgi:hypothetical protein
MPLDPEASNLRTLLAQPIEQLAHRARPHLGGSVEFDRFDGLARPRGEHRGEKARNRPRRSREQRSVTGRR